ncbi:MAG: universal stress protein [Myxococcales bacterium]|nr:universal stress protein [Myxococcales bacterium]MCB9691350.1 universal stress protein [Alphaproteobacteria bacterium]
MVAPLLVSLAFETETDDVLDTAIALAGAMGAPLATAHALGWRPLESDAQLAARIADARERIQGLLEPARAAGLELLEPVIGRGRPSELVVETGSTLGAQMIVTGGGSSRSMRRWLLGSVAESVVRASSLPVLVARGPAPDASRPVVCPLDLSPHSLEGFREAVRIARMFGCPVLTLTVVPEEEGYQSPEHVEKSLPRDPATARKRVATFVDEVDTEGLQIEHRIVADDEPSSAIARISAEGWLLVMATRSFDELRANALGAFTERVLRMTPGSALVLRVSGAVDDSPEAAVRRVGRLREQAAKHMAAGKAVSAVPLLELAVARANGNAALLERLADALDAAGREKEAKSRRALAALIREELDEEV